MKFKNHFRAYVRSNQTKKGLTELIEILDKCEEEGLVDKNEINDLRNQLTTILADWNHTNRYENTDTLDPDKIRIRINKVNSAFLNLIDSIDEYDSFSKFIKS